MAQFFVGNSAPDLCSTGWEGLARTPVVISRELTSFLRHLHWRQMVESLKIRSSKALCFRLPALKENVFLSSGYLIESSSFIDSDGIVNKIFTSNLKRQFIRYSYAIDGLSSAGLRVLLHPVTEEDDQDIFDRLLWSSKDPTNKDWLKAEVLYTYNREHKVCSLIIETFIVLMQNMKTYLSRRLYLKA